MRRSGVLRLKKWFDNSLSFSCTQCGKCCKGPTNVFVNDSEAEALAATLEISKFDFYKHFTVEKKTSDGFLTSLISKPDTSSSECIFLDGKHCSVYENRPTGCRTYPFWPHDLIGEAEWTSEAVRCEGIRVPPSASSVVPNADVLRNLITHEVHKRGLGPNWGYEDSVEYLKELEAAGSSELQDFEEEFYSTHYSQVLYSADGLRVIDTTVPFTRQSQGQSTSISSPSSSSSSGADSSVFERMEGLESAAVMDSIVDEEGEGEEEQPKHFITHRRMEFFDSLQITQSEAVMRPRTGTSPSAHVVDSAEEFQRQQQQVDHTQLLLPVHQHMARLALDLLERSGGGGEGESGRGGPPRVLVIGAGGCCLPMHLLRHKSSSPSTTTAYFHPHIDVVEPSATVLHVAEKYFDAVFVDSHLHGQGLVRHCTDGRSFLLGARGDVLYDIVLIDAHETTAPLPATSVDSAGGVAISADSVHSDVVSRAPPASLLESDCLSALFSRLQTGAVGGAGLGVVVINVLGDEPWVAQVQSSVDRGLRAARADGVRSVDKLINLNRDQGNNKLLVVSWSTQHSALESWEQRCDSIARVFGADF